ncbi:MAG TPA: N-acetylmuramic acid 6-phosphate etherase [Streptosporangiaceae bacterium]
MITARDVALLAGLGTEQANSAFSDLDQLPVTDLVTLMAAQAQRAGDAVAGAVRLLAPVVEEVVKRLEAGGRLVYVGAGTAGRLGMLDAAEAVPTFSVPAGTIVAVLAGGQEAFGNAAENVEDEPEAGADALDRLGVSDRDAVLGISASGRTPFVLGAIRRANELGALTVGLACNESTPLGAIAHLPVEIPIGPEVIAGSTRLNAGTVQKIALNIISTAAMVRLGKTFGSLMVDVKPTNAKLRERAVRIVTTITGASADAARDALAASDWRPKVASIVLAAGLDADKAGALLDRHRGRLRDALAASFSTGQVSTGQVSTGQGVSAGREVSRDSHGHAAPVASRSTGEAG